MSWRQLVPVGRPGRQYDRPAPGRRAMEPHRYRIVLGGAVQGVGLRPFVYRLARSLEFAGYVQNSSEGVVIEVEGSADASPISPPPVADRPASALRDPPEVRRVPPVGGAGFVIAGSAAGTLHAAGMLERSRHLPRLPRRSARSGQPALRYPFTNCTHCGPRLHIIRDTPYDRAAHDHARASPMCRMPREYDDPADRRFHAQPTPARAADRSVCGRRSPGTGRRQALRDGAIVALKGIGGFQLLVRCAQRARGRAPAARKHARRSRSR